MWDCRFSVPEIHIALMGIEKVIPRSRDLAVFLKLLIRSATGQKMTSYVNCLNGPRRSDELDGPQEFYLILIDNGRSKILADGFMRQSLSCIRCGACLNVLSCLSDDWRACLWFNLPGTSWRHVDSTADVR